MPHLMPYEGKEPFLFISYAHADSAAVMPYIAALMQAGYHVWYDYGIPSGTPVWAESLTKHIHSCTAMLVFLSDNYLRSDNCTNELEYMRNLRRPNALHLLMLHKTDPALERASGFALNHSKAHRTILNPQDIAGDIAVIGRAETVAACQLQPAAQAPFSEAAAEELMLAETERVLREYLEAANRNDRDALLKYTFPKMICGHPEIAELLSEDCFPEDDWETLTFKKLERVTEASADGKNAVGMTAFIATLIGTSPDRALAILKDPDNAVPDRAEEDRLAQKFGYPDWHTLDEAMRACADEEDEARFMRDLFMPSANIMQVLSVEFLADVQDGDDTEEELFEGILYYIRGEGFKVLSVI